MTDTTEKLMHYQVPCVCGHKFYIPTDKLNTAVACPKCNHPLIALAPPKAEAPAPEPAAEPAPKEATKRCEFCGETILAVARKCRFCGEFLDRAAPAPTGSAAATPELDQDEQAKKDQAATPVYAMSVSQWDNFFKYMTCLTVAGAAGFCFHVFLPEKQVAGTFIVSAAMAILMYFFYAAANSSRCIIRPARLETETGIFSKQTDTLELWRVIDIKLKQGTIERILGIGTIYLKTTDEKAPLLELYQIPQARAVFKYLQEQVPKVAKERGVVYIEK